MRRLTPEQMADLALASLSNARTLYDDAMLLRGSRRLAGAFVLAGLAMDEVGKHMLVASFYGARNDSDDEWRKFWRRFKAHQEKLGNALLSAWMGDLLNDDPPPDAKAFHIRRLAATYADVTEDGTVSVPSETITQAEVDDLLRKVAVELERCETGFKGATPETLGAVFSQMRDADETESVRGLIRILGHHAAFTYGVAIRNGTPHDDAMRLAQMASKVLNDQGAAS